MELIQKFKIKLAPKLKNYWRHFLFLGIISQTILIFLLQTVVFVCKKTPLESGWVLITDAVTKVFMVVFLLLFCIAYMDCEIKTKKEQYIQVWKDCAVIAALLFVLKYVPIMVFQYIGWVYPLPAIIASVGIAIIGFALLVIVVIRSVIDIQPIQYETRKTAWKSVKKKALLSLSTVGVVCWFLMGSIVLESLGDVFFSILPNRYNIHLLFLLGISLIQAYIYISYFAYIRKAFGEYSKNEEIEGNTEELTKCNGSSEIKRKIRFTEICAGIVTFAVVGLWLCDSVIVLRQNERKDIQTYIEQMVIKAREEIESGSRDEGIRLYLQTEEYMKALDCYVDDNADAIRNYTTENPADDFYWQLYYFYTQDIKLLEDRAIKAPGNIGYYQDLLVYYAEVEKIQNEEVTEELSEVTEDMQEEVTWQEYCIQKCLENGKVKADYACIDKKSIKKTTINELHRKYDDELSYGAILQELVNTGVKGKIDKESLYKVLDMADDNADNLAYQLIAIEYGSEYLDDEASHYDRVVEVVKRYDGLYMKMNPTEEELIEEKKYLVEILMDCGDYAGALELMKSVEDLRNETIENYVMICHSELEQQEELAAYTKKLIENQNEDANVYYYAALSHLKLGLLDESLEYGTKLSDMVIHAEGEDKEYNNAMLNSYVQYLCISDKYKNYIQYKYRVKEFTSEQWKVIEQAPLLYEYIIATNAIYNNNDYETARKALENADKISPDLSITWFLRGTSYFNEENFEEAMKCFKICVKIDSDNVTALYCMAALYDRAGEYEMSYQLCNQVIERLPYVNHEIDWYGVAYHIVALKEKLSPYITEAEQ